MSIRLIAVIACAGLAACATGRSSGPSAAAAEVQVYNSTQLVPTQYSVIDHIWIDSWRSNFSYPTFRTSEEGVQAMREAARRAGASGILNVMCLDGGGRNQGPLLCYGDAIRLN
jgi:hypothetical protein